MTRSPPSRGAGEFGHFCTDATLVIGPGLPPGAKTPRLLAGPEPGLNVLPRQKSPPGRGLQVQSQ